MNTQNKLEFLASEVMKDMTELVDKVEAATKSLSITKTALSSATEHQLINAIKQIEQLAEAISTNKSGIENASVSVVNNLLLGNDGPVKKLNDLFILYQYNTRQNSAWMEIINKHTGSFFKTTIFAGILCGLLGGVVSGIILKVI